MIAQPQQEQQRQRWRAFTRRLEQLADEAAKVLEASPCGCALTCNNCCELQDIAERLDALARLTARVSEKGIDA